MVTFLLVSLSLVRKGTNYRTSIKHRPSRFEPQNLSERPGEESWNLVVGLDIFLFLLLPP